ncbi:hypothetical protein D3C72_2437710 [compost metagenome]
MPPLIFGGAEAAFIVAADENGARIASENHFRFIAAPVVSDRISSGATRTPMSR